MSTNFRMVTSPRNAPETTAVIRRARGGSASNRPASSTPSAGMRTKEANSIFSIWLGTRSAKNTSAPARTVVPMLTPRAVRG
ncbi:hypothetical protein SPURM210S_05828 [Streptomyces purpurascens]